MTPIIETSEKFRIFINISSSACASRCNYCYVPSGRPLPHQWSNIEVALHQMLAADTFVPGKNGTIITFGGHTDIFRSKILITLLIRSLNFICPLGNPIQVSTKQFIDLEILKEIRGCLQYSGQIALFVSCASISHAATVEPGADLPTKRWLTFSNQLAVGLPRALLIKPWLSSTTKHDLQLFGNVAAEFKLNAVCAGPLYVTHGIRKSIGPLDFEIDAIRGTAKHPLICEPHFSISPPPLVLSEFRANLGWIPLFSSSICISAKFANINCPLHGEIGCHALI